MGRPLWHVLSIKHAPPLYRGPVRRTQQSGLHSGSLGTHPETRAARPRGERHPVACGAGQAGTPPCPAYNIRVLIPCYTESLDIVATVVLAAADALPPGKCRRTVYLLDDGKDRAKAAWVAAQARLLVGSALLIARCCRLCGGLGCDIKDLVNLRHEIFGLGRMHV